MTTQFVTRTLALGLASVVIVGCQRGNPAQDESASESSAAPATTTAQPPSTASPAPTPAESTEPAPTGTDPVPGMKRAELGDACTDTEHFIFAISSAGQTLACRGEPAQYYGSAAVIGVRDPGTPCTEEGLAQAPDGSPLACLAQEGGLRWGIYLDF